MNLLACLIKIFTSKYRPKDKEGNTKLICQFASSRKMTLMCRCLLKFSIKNKSNSTQMCLHQAYTQSVVQGPTASVAPGNLLAVQILWPFWDILNQHLLSVRLARISLRSSALDGWQLMHISRLIEFAYVGDITHVVTILNFNSMHQVACESPYSLLAAASLLPVCPQESIWQRLCFPRLSEF